MGEREEERKKPFSTYSWSMHLQYTVFFLTSWNIQIYKVSYVNIEALFQFG